MAITGYNQNLCSVYNKQSELSCKREDLDLLENLSSTIDQKTGREKKVVLLACRVCGQVYRESISVYNNTPYSTYDKIKGQRIDQCHCIGYLEEVKVLFEERSGEENSWSFSWKKETLMKCRKCGKEYKESIIQNDYDQFYSRKYVEAL